ncbi:MAG: hypothetical protein ABSD88_03640, partial [Candidatus Korobacteraceae bacterium]
MPLRINYRQYYAHVFTRAFTETKTFTQHKLTVSAIMAIIVRVAFWGFAQVQLTWSGVGHELLRDLLIVVICYAIATAGSFCFNLIRVPALIDADYRSEVGRLSEELALPDKELAEHITELLNQVSDVDKKIVWLILMHGEITRPHVKVPEVTWEQTWKSLEKCIDVGLLRIGNPGNPSSGALWQLSVSYYVPPEFRDSL